MSELELWNELGNIYNRTGAYNEAIRTYQRMIELNPGYGPSYNHLACLFVSQGRYTEAIPQFLNAIEFTDETRKQACLWNQLGDAHRKLGDYNNACACYRKASELDPEETSYQKNLSEVELSSCIFVSEAVTGANKEFLPAPERENPVEDDLETTPESNPNLPRFTGEPEPGNACWVFKEGEQNVNMEGNVPEASESSPVILGSRMLSDESVENHGSLNPADGASSIEQTVNRDGSPHPSAQALLRLGIVHWRKKEYERAIHFLKIGINSSARSHNIFLEALCYNATAVVETDLGKIEEAIQAYQSAANLAPERIFPWNNLGNLYCMLERYEEAQAAYREAIEHNSKNPVSWNGLGDMYHKLGRDVDAIAAYQLGNVFEKKTNDEDALKEFVKSIDMDQENPQVWNEAGDIYFTCGAYEDAIASYRKANELDPANAIFHYNLAKAEQALSKYDPGNEPGAPQTMAENEVDALMQTELCDIDTASVQPAERYPTQADTKSSDHSLETGFIPGAFPNLPNRVASSGAQAAYWMFEPGAPHGNLQKPALRGTHDVADTMVSTLIPSPVFAIQTHPDQIVSAGQVQKVSDQNNVNLLVQLSPRATKPAGTREIINPPVATHPRESACSEMDLGVYQPASVSTQNTAENSALHATATGNHTTNQLSPDLQVLENDIGAYRRVIEINPRNDRAWDALGNMYEAAGLHTEAISAFEQSIALDPRKEVYHYHLGIALAYQKQYDKAIQAFQGVVALNPDYMLAHCALAGCYRRLGKEATAQEHIAIARPSMEDENEYNRACFESISGNVDRAFELLEIAFEKQQIQPEMIRSDPDLDFIRTDARFGEMLYKNGIINQ